MAMHGEHMEVQPAMGLKGGSDDGGVRSYQVPSKVQGEAGYMHVRGEVCTGVQGGAWRQLHRDHGKTWMFGFMKLKSMDITQ